MEHEQEQKKISFRLPVNVYKFMPIKSNKRTNEQQK